MEQSPYNINQLAYKWQKGTLTADERIYFDQWYAGFSDEEVLLVAGKYANSEQLRSDILKQLNNKIDALPVARQAKVIPLWRRMAAAAAVILLIGTLALFKNPLLNLVNPVKQLQVSARPGEYRQLNLADGTRVWLSPSSTISYPESFGGDIRLVAVTGEAFFEVKHDRSHPFVIQSTVLRTTVLGTSFDVLAYPNQPTAQITVVSGKVGVSDKQQTKFVEASQRVIYSLVTHALIKENDPNAARYLQRRLGLFDYKDGAVLSSITTELEARYHIHILLDESLQQKTFYGRLRFSDPLNQTLDKLAAVMGIQWHKEGERYRLQQMP